jgi:hypothetical protein
LDFLSVKLHLIPANENTVMTIIDGVDYGPLYPLLGRWIGGRGLDRAPQPEAPEETPFIDEIEVQLAGAATNADEQDLVAVRYRHLVRKQENGLIFHDQIGHWIYEPETGLIMFSLTIPRGVCLLAGGSLQQEADQAVFSVRADAGSTDFGIVQSPFMLEKAKTTAFEMTMTLSGDQLEYTETTHLHIYGEDFEHTDKSRLSRVRYELD